MNKLPFTPEKNRLEKEVVKEQESDSVFFLNLKHEEGFFIQGYCLLCLLYILIMWCQNNTSKYL